LIPENVFFPVLNMKKSTTIYQKKIKSKRGFANLKYKMSLIDSDEEKGLHFPPINKYASVDKNLNNSFKPTVNNPSSFKNFSYL
jgi:hypothetical protein